MFRRRTPSPAQQARKLAHASLQRECQICERRQSLSSKALLVLHGYERPGHGFINGKCFGVGFVDYSKGTDALVLYHDSLSRMLTEANDVLVRYVRGEVTHFTTVEHGYAKDTNFQFVYRGRKIQTVPRLIGWAPGVSNREKYERHLTGKHLEAATHVSQLESEIARVERRIAAFVPPPDSSP